MCKTLCYFNEVLDLSHLEENVEELLRFHKPFKVCVCVCVCKYIVFIRFSKQPFITSVSFPPKLRTITS